MPESAGHPQECRLSADRRGLAMVTAVLVGRAWLTQDGQFERQLREESSLTLTTPPQPPDQDPPPPMTAPTCH